MTIYGLYLYILLMQFLCGKYNDYIWFIFTYFVNAVPLWEVQ
jgi:hypothetical protein